MSRIVLEQVGATGGLDEPTVEVRWPRDQVAHVILRGEHDVATAGRVGQSLRDALDQATQLVVDLSSTTFIDSSTIHTLLTTKREADAAGKGFNLVLGTASIVERTLDVAGVQRELNCVQTLQEVPTMPLPG